MAEPEPARRLGPREQRSGHPRLPAALLLVGVTLLIVVLSLWSTFVPS